MTEHRQCIFTLETMPSGAVRTCSAAFKFYQETALLVHPMLYMYHLLEKKEPSRFERNVDGISIFEDISSATSGIELIVRPASPMIYTCTLVKAAL